MTRIPNKPLQATPGNSRLPVRLRSGRWWAPDTGQERPSCLSFDVRGSPPRANETRSLCGPAALRPTSSSIGRPTPRALLGQAREPESGSRIDPTSHQQPQNPASLERRSFQRPRQPGGVLRRHSLRPRPGMTDPPALRRWLSPTDTATRAATVSARLAEPPNPGTRYRTDVEAQGHGAIMPMPRAEHSGHPCPMTCCRMCPGRS